MVVHPKKKPNNFETCPAHILRAPLIFPRIERDGRGIAVDSAN
jgi:hypothetical protein